MNYIELQQKELLLKYISIKLSEKLHKNLNFEYIIRYNDKLITATTFQNFNNENFSFEYVCNDFGTPKISTEQLDFPTTKHIEDYYIDYLVKLFKLSKLNFTSNLLKQILKINIEYDFSKNSLEIYDVKFLENNISLNFLLVSEKDNFEIISLNIID